MRLRNYTHSHDNFCMTKTQTHNYTFSMLKPDAVSRHLIGEIIHQIECTPGIAIAYMQTAFPTADQAAHHIPLHDMIWIETVGHKTLDYFAQHQVSVKQVFGTDDAGSIGQRVTGYIQEYIVSGPVVSMIITGDNAPCIMKELCGATIPSHAAAGSLRNMYGQQDNPITASKQKRAVMNLIHTSDDNQVEIDREARVWFGDTLFEQIIAHQL